MTTQEIFDRTERNATLFGATLAELTEARVHATREIHRHEIAREIKTKQKEAKARSKAVDNSIPKRRFSHTGPRVPTKRELK
jgi:hypothetical protein